MSRNDRYALNVLGHWLSVSRKIEDAATGLEPWPYIRQCGIAWYVLGVLYERDNWSLVSDCAYDALSAHLLNNLDAAYAAGSNLLKAEELRAGTAMGWQSFPIWATECATILSSVRGRRELADTERAPRPTNPRDSAVSLDSQPPAPNASDLTSVARMILGDVL